MKTYGFNRISSRSVTEPSIVILDMFGGFCCADISLTSSCSRWSCATGDAAAHRNLLHSFNLGVIRSSKVLRHLNVLAAAESSTHAAVLAVSAGIPAEQAASVAELATELAADKLAFFKAKIPFCWVSGGNRQKAKKKQSEPHSWRQLASKAG